MKKFIIRRHYDSTALNSGEYHPVLRRIYAARNVRSGEELQHSLDRLLPPDSLLDIDKAVALLVEAITERRRILIVADFDVDGATSCSLALLALKKMGAESVEYIVPDRFRYGYGLSPEITEVAVRREPHLIVTVDNGISSHDGVRLARKNGVKVLITDHHLASDELPPADAIVNPNQAGDLFPSKSLAGVGVIFYVMAALRAALRDLGWFAEQSIPEPIMAEYLDLVAVGTVADLVPLDHNNRIMVAQGLARIRRGACLDGIKALLKIARRSMSRTTAADIAFAIAPRLNAAGRLEDMSLGIECLTGHDIHKCHAMAEQLDQLNRARRVIEADMESEALRDLAAVNLSESADDTAFSICLYNESWHQGVIGILASRVKDRTNRPVIAFAGGDVDELKGSARSIPGLHIRDALDSVCAKNPGIIRKFGGHAMAAGITIDRQRYPEFAALFEEEVRRHVTAEDLRGAVYSDGELETQELSLEFADMLWQAGPWGQGFPEPVFDGEFKVVSSRIVGERHVKYRLNSGDSRHCVDAVAFNAADQRAQQTNNEVRIAYRLHSNEYQQQRRAQLIVDYMEPIASPF